MSSMAEIERRHSGRSPSMLIAGVGSLLRWAPGQKLFLVWPEEQWRSEQRVSRTMIFRKVLDIDPKFKGGVPSDGYLARRKKWCYYGYKICPDLSHRKICGAGQKLPANGEQACLLCLVKYVSSHNPR